PEAKLAREAEICYAIIACSTDYDCWHETAEAVSVEVILNILRQNINMSKRIIHSAVAKIPAQRTCPCATALQNAIVTAPELIPAEQKKTLDLLIGKYIT
ncbi:MAG: S-methyl-5'-thioadenosine phosphorylase, partial [Chloroflexota bacterium]